MESIETTIYGAASILSTAEKGVAFAISLPVKVQATLTSDKKISGRIPLNLKKLAKKTLKFLGHSEHGLKIKIDNELPAELGKEEATSLAVTFAVAGALAREHGSINELQIEKYWKEQFFIIDDQVIDKKELLCLCPESLKFEKLAASFYGGFAITDNNRREILRRGEMERFSLALKKLTKKRKHQSNSEVETIWREALSGKLYSAMKLTASIHASEETAKITKKGTIVSFSPPYLIILSKNKKTGLSTINQGVTVLRKPKRIYRINDFLKIDGAKLFF